MANTETVGVLRVLLEASAAQFESTLKSAEGKASGVSRSLARLTSSFSGQSLANEALKVAEAVSRVGGVTKLTEAELSRVRGTVDQVTAKFKLMGAEVPPSIAKLSSEINALNTSTAQIQKPLISMERLMQGIAAGAAAAVTTKLLGMGAALASFGAESLARGSQMEALGGAFERLAGGAAQAEEMLRHLRRGTSGLVDDMALMQGANKAMLLGLGLSSEEMGKLAQTATVLGRAMGQDATKSLDDLIVALGRSSPLILDNLGLTVKVGEANEKYAEQLGKSSSALTDAEKKQAFMNAAMEAASVKVQQLGDVQLTAAEHGTKLWTSIRNLSDATANWVVSNYLVNLALRQTTDGMSTLENIIRSGPLAAWREYHGLNNILVPEIKKLGATHAEVAGDVREMALSEDELFAAMASTSDELERSTARVSAAATATRELAAEKERAAKAVERFRESIRSLTSVMVPFAASVTDARDGLHDLASGTLQETAEETERARIETEQWADANGARLAPSLQDAKVGAEALGTAAAGLAETLRADLLQTLQSIPQTLASAFTGGGDIMGAIKSIVSQVGKGLGQMAASAMGFIGPWGQAIGSAIGSLAPLVINAFDKLFGKGQHKKVNDLRDRFVDAAGGIHELNVKAQAAGLTLDRFLRAKTVKEYEAAVAELSAAFEVLEANRQSASDLFGDIMAAGSSGIPAAYRPAIEKLIELGLLTDEQAAKLRALGDGAVVDVDKMTAAMDVLNGRVESLGPAFRQAQIDKTAKQYVNAIDTLIKGGGDVGGILFDAKEELSDLVNQSIESGTVLPANMKPWIEELARAGLLVDENGEKITDLSNLKYGAEMKTEAQIAEDGWNRIIAAIEKLVATLNGPLSSAINNLPAVPTGPAPAPADGGGADPGFVGGTISRFGRFFNVFPKSGFPTTLHGTEAVITPDQAVPFARSVMASGMPGLPSLAAGALSVPGGAGGLSGGTVTTTSSSQTTNLGVLVVQPGETMDPYRIADEVFRQLPDATAMDKHGLTTAFEQVIENYLRTYQHG